MKSPSGVKVPLSLSRAREMMACSRAPQIRRTFTHRGVPSPSQEKIIATGWFNYQ